MHTATGLSGWCGKCSYVPQTKWNYNYHLETDL